MSFGHASISRLKSLVSSKVLGHVNNQDFDCLASQLFKQSTLLFNKSESISYAPFNLVDYDVWDHSPTATMGGSKYYVIFVDDYSRYTWLFLMHNRSELQQIYFNFATMFKT